MVVVVIIGILSTVALPRFMTQQKKAKEGAAWADMDAISTALDMYYLDCDTYPKGGTATVHHSPSGSEKLALLVSDTAAGWSGPYLKFRKHSANQPLDPWRTKYGYWSDADGNAYSILCQGGRYDGATHYSAFYINPGPFTTPR